MSYLVTGTGKTVKEARKVFEGGYEDTKRYYAEIGKPFEEVEFCYKYELPAFLKEYSEYFSLAGLERITGINQAQLGHYISGFRNPSPKTVKKFEDGLKKFIEELTSVKFA